MTLEARALGLHYGTLEALRDVTVRAAPGRITAVIGPNAAGKSTLLRCLIGALRPTAGAALIDGRPVHRVPARRLAARIAYVAQRPSVAASFTVGQVVELGRFALSPDPKRIREAIARLELESVADRPFAALSVGQQQRVALARARAQIADDGHLVLDEPTAAMDLAHERDAFRVLRELADRGTTVLVAMHDLALAAALADDAWLLAEGRLVHAGLADRVMRPEQLAAIFDVEFRAVRDEDGRGAMIAEMYLGEATKRRSDGATEGGTKGGMEGGPEGEGSGATGGRA